MSFLDRCIVCAVLLPISVGVCASVATIGPTADCDYVTTGANNAIAQALADGRRDVRVVANTLNEGSAGIFLSDANPQLRIRGGYIDCAAAASGSPVPSTAARSQWRASTGQSLMAVASFGPARHNFQLSGFTLQPAADTSVVAPNGGALVIAGPINATVEMVEASNFRANDRGGAMLFSSSADVSLRATHIQSSTAQRGGGLACENSAIWMDAQSRISGNQALQGAPAVSGSGQGGGAYLEGCSLVSESRVDETGSPLTGGISYNHASDLGGGIAAQSSQVFVLGGSNCFVTGMYDCIETLASMIGNTAGGDGGAVHADDSQIAFNVADVSGNTAHHRGAGIAGINDSRIILNGAVLQGTNGFCRNAGCVRMRNNQAGSSGQTGAGGAIALDASRLESSDAVLENNHAWVGSAIAVTNASTALLVQNVISQRIPAPGQPFHSMVFAGWNSAVTMNLSTTILDGVDAPQAPGMLALADGAGFFSSASVLFSRGAPLLSAQPTAAIDTLHACNAISDAGLTAVLDAVLIDATDFENPAMPLRPALHGAMVDVCPGIGTPYMHQIDIEGRPRVVAAIPGREATPQDAGAFEVQNDAVFSDGFEQAAPMIF